MNDEGTVTLSELFASIQGESTFSGLPCLFVRLWGCNLRCSWCDARYTYEEEGRSSAIPGVRDTAAVQSVGRAAVIPDSPGTRPSLPVGRSITVAEVLAWAAGYPGFMPVELTGGEPLLQENIYPLMAGLLAAGRTLLLETNGSIALDRVPDRVVKIMDVKCPASGMADRLHLPNLDLLGSHDQIKFVLASRHDYDWALDFITAHRLAGRELLFSPVTGAVAPQDLAQWIMADQAPVRLQLQLHKILWPDAVRGK